MTAMYGSTDRWNAMRSALLDSIGVITSLASSVYFGATLYTARSALDMNGVQVGIPPCPRLTQQARALDNYMTLRDWLASLVPVEDAPTAESIDAVVQGFMASPPPAGSPPIVVLATDGTPDTCADADPPPGPRQDAVNAVTVAAAQRAHAAGIRLLVLFVGDDVDRPHIQQLANAGAGLDPVTGSAAVYTATDPAQLTAALRSIVEGRPSCDVRLSRQVDTEHVTSGTVTLNGATLIPGTDWTLDADRITLHILGGACSTLTSVATPVLDATFSC
jgi:hypothetical protein